MILSVLILTSHNIFISSLSITGSVLWSHQIFPIGIYTFHMTPNVAIQPPCLVPFCIPFVQVFIITEYMNYGFITGTTHSAFLCPFLSHCHHFLISSHQCLILCHQEQYSSVCFFIHTVLAISNIHQFPSSSLLLVIDHAIHFLATLPFLFSLSRFSFQIFVSSSFKKAFITPSSLCTEFFK